MRKLIVAIILILANVRASELSSTSFDPPSLPIPLSHTSKLDNSHKSLSLYTCLPKKLKYCEKTLTEVDPADLAKCIINGLINCLTEVNVQLEDREMHVIIGKFNECARKHHDSLIETVECFHQWLKITTTKRH